MSEISLIESYILRADGITEEKIKNYFSGIKYRGIYFVTMKTENSQVTQRFVINR